MRHHEQGEGIENSGHIGNYTGTDGATQPGIRLSDKSANCRRSYLVKLNRRSSPRFWLAIRGWC